MLCVLPYDLWLMFVMCCFGFDFIVGPMMLLLRVCLLCSFHYDLLLSLPTCCFGIVVIVCPMVLLLRVFVVFVSL